jgi:hypothetical protein
VKLALEAAEMDMPEPIYRVQITEHIEAAAASGSATSASAKVPGEEVVVDTRVNADLDQQIEQDQLTHGSEDLLDPAAPRE